MVLLPLPSFFGAGDETQDFVHVSTLPTELFAQAPRLNLMIPREDAPLSARQGKLT